ncbi:PhzF family phenazine biosynthesis protein, partial [Streptomyces sp. ISL-11]|uniref:PhzF family phenazine biosynthesis protein n=1 Tax=Streptomyces sp. ISL-11 TaxID=2819174 RepID=UPI0027E598C1
MLSVFGGPGGRGGNLLGVVREGAAVPGERRRLALAAALGYSETVFVDDTARAVLDIFTPSARLPFAGHPLVGVAHLLGAPVLRPPAGEVAAWR